MSDALSPRPQYRCGNQRRAELVRDSALNGIDFLEVLDRVLAPQSSLRQTVILVYLFKPLPAGLGAENVVITGGVRVVSPPVVWAVPAQSIVDGTADPDVVPPGERAELAPVLGDPEVVNPADLPRILAVRTATTGDFSRYELSLIDPAKVQGPGEPVLDGFDAPLSRVLFSFKVECPSDFDCVQEEICPPEVHEAPAIDYLAKDYESFRALMLDRMALTLPDWKERNPADLGVAIVELLAYAADHVSYFQDAAANEAYLGTARLRPSLRRHARLLDYTPREGSNARTFVHIGFEGLTVELPAGTRLVSRTTSPTVVLTEELFESAVSGGAVVFETMHDLELREPRTEMLLHTWGDEDCCLPAGATRATLADPFENIVLEDGDLVGDLLAFVEVRSPDPGGAEADADPTHRHVVRVTSVEVTFDPLFRNDADTGPLRVIQIEWAPEDKLPFAVCARGGAADPVTVVRGNIVLADHGRAVSEALPPPPEVGRFRPTLGDGPVTFRGQVQRSGEADPVAFDEDAPAAAALSWDPRSVRPSILLFPEGDGDCADDPDSHEQLWLPRLDLLASDAFAEHFVVETTDDGRAQLRFGDGVFGKRPTVQLRACYRIGNGTAGNVGADGLAHIVTDVEGIARVANPVPATGGAEPESMEEIRQSAPQAFKVQERAVTEADYAEIALRHPDIQRAVATRRFTGSWYTMFVAVDRFGGLAVDQEFESELTEFLDRFRLAGYDLEIEGAILVPLEIELEICVHRDFFREDVQRSLLDTLSARDLPDGRRGFFHPDNLTFGQPIFLSRLVATALAVPGVASVTPLTFKRLNEVASNELATGVLPMARLEIAQLDNDPNQPELGQIQLVMRGGA